MKILVCLLLGAAAAVAAPGVDPDEMPPESRPLFPLLEKALDDVYVPRPRASFAPVTQVERKRFFDAFTLLVSEACDAGGAPSAAARNALDGVGFRTERVSAGGDPVWGVFERVERTRGGGAFLLRVGPDAGPWKPRGGRGRGVERVVLLAPHPRSDRGTERLAQRLFGMTRARALIQSTVNRTTRAADGTPADPAHRADTFFQVATEALEARWTDQLFLELHGFEVKRHDDLPPTTAAILSDANPAPHENARFLAAAAVLRERHAPGTIALWGTDTRHLGGTTNAQARYINPRGRNTFMHVEMSATTRSDALADTAGMEPPAGSWMHSLLELIAGR